MVFTINFRVKSTKYNNLRVAYYFKVFMSYEREVRLYMIQVFPLYVHWTHSLVKH
jgi:hypothetical protein